MRSEKLYHSPRSRACTWKSYITILSCSSHSF